MQTNPTQRGAVTDDDLGETYLEIEPLVLLVEDDTELRAVLSLDLTASGYDVVSVGNGADALRYLELAASDPRGVRPPEAIITDVRMPRFDGLQLLELVRHADWHTPVIVISAYADDEMRSEAQRLGATLLAKPFELKELQAKLEALMPS